MVKYNHTSGLFMENSSRKPQSKALKRLNVLLLSKVSGYGTIAVNQYEINRP